MYKVILWLVFIIPIISLFFFGQKTLRRYMGAGLLVIVMNTLFYQAAWEYNWFREKNLFGWDKVANVPWVYIAYPVLTILVLKFTFGRFWLYFMVNLILDIIFCFFWYPLADKIGLMLSKEIKPFYDLLVLTFMSLSIYTYQVWQEGGISKKQ